MEQLDRATNNSLRITGLIFLSALLIIHVVLLLDDDRRHSLTDGRFIYGLGLPGWIVFSAVIVFLAGWITLIIVGWVRSNRRRREGASPGKAHTASD